jgi:cytochrome bd-type quinol oxidase subunit 1
VNSFAVARAAHVCVVVPVLQFSIMSSRCSWRLLDANPAGPFNTLSVLFWSIVVLVIAWQYIEGQNHSFT